MNVNTLELFIIIIFTFLIGVSFGIKILGESIKKWPSKN
jgi:hypothetical protein